MKKKSVFANQTMRIGLLMLLDALLISASLLMGLQVYYDMHAPAAHILHVWRSLQTPKLRKTHVLFWLLLYDYYIYLHNIQLYSFHKM